MTIHDDSYGDDPPPAEPVRRDPNIGIGRLSPSAFADVQRFRARPLWQRVYGSALLAALVFAAGLALLILAGVAARELSRAIMLGWGLG